MRISDLFPFTGNSKVEQSDDMLEFLNKCYQIADNARRRFEPDWFANIAYLAGNQWEAYESDVLRFRKIEFNPPQAKAKVTNNLILPLVRQAASALRAGIASMVAIANTTEPEDIAAAQLATDFLSWRFVEDDEEEKIFQDILWSMCCGRVLRKTWWNVLAGREGMRGVGGEGDIQTDRVNPFRYLVCPWDETGEWPPQWIIESDVRDVDWVEQQFGAKVAPEDTASERRALDNLLLNVIDSKSVPDSRKNACILKRMYVRPNDRHVNGKVFVWAGNVLLRETELPDGIFPFVPLDWFYVPGRLYPLPMITPLRPLQREINITLSQLIELKNRQLRGDLLVQGDGDVRQIVDDRTGQKRIHVDAGTTFQLMRYDLNITEAESILMKCWNYMMEIAGLHESALGQTPPRAVTATQVQLLKESDMSGLSVFRRQVDLYEAGIARQKLILAQKHYNNQRMLRVIGETGITRSQAFFGSDLRGAMDVRPVTKPLLTPTLAANMKMEAAMQGLFGPYQSLEDELAKRTALQAMQIPGVEDEMSGMIPLEELRAMVSEIRRAKAMIEMTDAQNAINTLFASQQQTNMQQGDELPIVPRPYPEATAPVGEAPEEPTPPVGEAPESINPEELGEEPYAV